MAKAYCINNVNKQVKYDSMAITLQPLNIYEVALVRLKYMTLSLSKPQININQYYISKSDIR
jgi:DNA-binding transcriptional regulator WhiA